MRVFGKVALGVGALAIIYFCVDILTMRRAPQKRLVVSEEATLPREEPMLPQVESKPVLAKRTPVLIEPKAPPAASQAPVGDEPAEHPQPDRSTELATALDAQYASDARPTRESLEREGALKGMFSIPELTGKGRLQELSCRETVCRGVVRLDNEGADNEVFGRTFLSPAFTTKISDAVAVASREKQSDGSVLATFFIYPQSVHETMTP